MRLRCPYCDEEMITGETSLIYCCTCGTAHHLDCWEENNGCTVFGCTAAPAEEAKISVGPADLLPDGSSVPRALAGVPRMPPPPRLQTNPSPPASPIGYPLSYTQNTAPLSYGPPPVLYPALYDPPRSRTAFVLLGIFFGALGAHNFYAGYYGRAIAQLCLTVCSLSGLLIITMIWSLIEVCVVKQDSRGVAMN